MKRFVLSMMLASQALAMGEDVVPTWHYALPETGLMPSAFSVDIMAPMRERHGGASHFGMTEVSLTIPLSDPYRSSFRGWAFHAALDSMVSFVDAEGTLGLENDTLYRFTLPLSLIHKSAAGHRLILGVAPTLSSDLGRSARSFDLGVMAAYTIPQSEQFSFTVGLGVFPRFGNYGLIPLVGFEWKASEDWKVTLKGYRLSAMKSMTERFSAGVFAGGEGGVWTVETQRGLRLLNVRSLVVGLCGEYDFSQPGQRKRLITASLGSTLVSSVRFHQFNHDRDADEAHHYRPGLYASFGMDCRF